MRLVRVTWKIFQKGRKNSRNLTLINKVSVNMTAKKKVKKSSTSLVLMKDQNRKERKLQVNLILKTI